MDDQQVPPRRQSGAPALQHLLAVDGPVGAEELVQDLAGGAGWRLERIVSHGHTAPPPPQRWYDQDEDEWVMVIAGAARLEFEADDPPMQLATGDAVWLPAHCRHRVAWTDPATPTVWIALFIPTEG